MRPRAAQAYRVLIGLKVTADMAAEVDAARGKAPRTDWCRAALRLALDHGTVPVTDWQRRALEAEARLARIAAITQEGSS